MVEALVAFGGLPLLTLPELGGWHPRRGTGRSDRSSPRPTPTAATLAEGGACAARVPEGALVTDVGRRWWPAWCAWPPRASCESVTGELVRVAPASICLHGDTPGARSALAVAVREPALTAAVGRARCVRWMTLTCLPMGETALLVGCGDLTHRAPGRRSAALRRAPVGAPRTVPAYDTVLVVGRSRDASPSSTPSPLALPSWRPALPPSSLPTAARSRSRSCTTGPTSPTSARLDRPVHGTTVVALHTAPAYAVAFVGFSPGFPYLVGLDPRLAVPRLDSAARSLGGPRLGRHRRRRRPASTPPRRPGGWRLIGRTSAAALRPLAARSGRRCWPPVTPCGSWPRDHG